MKGVRTQSESVHIGAFQQRATSSDTKEVNNNLSLNFLEFLT